MKEYRAKSFLIAMVSAAFIGVAWELLENFYQLAFTNAEVYGYNTAIDLLNDVIGGVLAYLYFTRRTTGSKHVSEIVHPFYDKVGVSH